MATVTPPLQQSSSSTQSIPWYSSPWVWIALATHYPVSPPPSKSLQIGLGQFLLLVVVLLEGDVLTPEEPLPKILQAKMFWVVITAMFGVLIFDKTVPENNLHQNTCWWWGGGRVTLHSTIEDKGKRKCWQINIHHRKHHHWPVSSSSSSSPKLY